MAASKHSKSAKAIPDISCAETTPPGDTQQLGVSQAQADGLSARSGENRSRRARRLPPAPWKEGMREVTTGIWRYANKGVSAGVVWVFSSRLIEVRGLQADSVAAAWYHRPGGFCNCATKVSVRACKRAVGPSIALQSKDLAHSSARGCENLCQTIPFAPEVLGTTAQNMRHRLNTLDRADTPS